MSRVNWRKVGIVPDAAWRIWRILTIVAVMVCMFAERYAPAGVLMLFLISAQLWDIEKKIKSGAVIVVKTPALDKQ